MVGVVPCVRSVDAPDGFPQGMLAGDEVRIQSLSTSIVTVIWRTASPHTNQRYNRCRERSAFHAVVPAREGIPGRRNPSGTV